MIQQIVRIHFLRLWHTKSDLVLTFLVPIAFFSVFAMIFGNRDKGKTTPKIKVAISDHVRDAKTGSILQGIVQTDTLRLHRSETIDDKSLGEVELFRSSQVADLVQRGIVNVGIVFLPIESAPVSQAEPEGFIGLQGDLVASRPQGSAHPVQDVGAKWKVQILADSYDQVAPQVVSALIQKVALADSLQPTNRSPSTLPGATQVADGVVQASSFKVGSFPSPVPALEVVDILGGTRSNPAVAMYAAGIAVMFLLFSMTTAGASLLDEKENGTFERIMTTQLSIDQLLMGKWLFMVIIGSAQVTLMFLWGQFVFGIELFRHIDGFVAMTIATVGSASSFALMLAAICSSRSQLNWISVVIILAMSALGGSMVPRYLMSSSMQSAGLWTFNAWALEGYNKVFWRDLPVRDLSPELAVLTASGFLFIVLARLFIRSWEKSC